MKKRLLVILCTICLSLTCFGCSSLTYNNDNIETSINNYMLTRIPNTDVPSGWKTAEFMSFYYDINTYIIYVSKNDSSLDSNIIYELKSADFRNYVYDLETKEFVGVK